jgi:ribosomal protein S18 acetylase RimI-like enzyme
MDDPNEDPIEIAVARDREQIIGVAVYGPDGTNAVTVWAIGVIRPRQRQGIGTALKVAALADVAYRPDWPGRVQSVVHRENLPMLRINQKLRARIEIDPLDVRYCLTAIVPRVERFGHP